VVIFRLKVSACLSIFADISQTFSDPPARPLLNRYPIKVQSGARRSFQATWYERHDWMEYSQQADAVFCYACRHFALSGVADKAFTSNGFSNWKKAHYKDGGLMLHARSDCHMQAVIAWQDHRHRDVTKSILHQLTDERARQIQENRHYIGAVVNTLKFTAAHRLAQRGHNEDFDSVNAGNFLDLMKLLGQYNDTIAKKLTDLPRNAKYVCHNIQNEILSIMANMIVNEIASEVREAGEFAVMADESKDCRKTEQLSIVLRYLLHGTVYESFVGFVPTADLSAEGVSTQIVSHLEKLKLDYKNMLVGQGYDGASVMSGKHKGVAKIIKDKATLALYVHCHAHRLNLVLVDAVKAVQAAAEFFALMEKLYVFVSGSYVHRRWTEIQTEMFKGERVRELQKLSDTRWACRYMACKAVCDRFSAIICLLTALACDTNAHRALEACSLLSAIDMSFVVTLHVMCDVFGKLQSLSRMLQASSFDLSAAVDLIDVVAEDLKVARNEESHFDSIWADAQSLCASCGIVTADESSTSSGIQQTSRVRRLPKRLQESIIMESVGERPVVNSKTAFRQHVYLPVMDNLLSEFVKRFDSTQCAVMRGIEALGPQSKRFADFSEIQQFAEAYCADTSDLQHELHQAKRMLERLSISAKIDASVAVPVSLLQFVSYLSRYGEAFHELYRLGRIAVSLPVSTASCERSFSALRQIKTWVRNSMSDSRLCNVSVLAIERERVHSLSVDAVVDAFAVAHKNRRIALL